MNTDAVAALSAAQHRLLRALLMPSTTQELQRQQDLPTELDQMHPQAQRGWQAYRANAQATARNTLAVAYPVITALLGETTLTQVARDLWQKHPPTRGDLAQWGVALPPWLAECADLAALPYLADVARAEWALHRAASAADIPIDTASFVRLTQDDPDTLTLVLAPGTAVLCSRFPVVSIMAAHRPDGPDFTTVAQRLNDGVAECALVWRQGLAPRLSAFPEPAAALVAALLRGASLLQALDEAGARADAAPPKESPFDFSQWLQDAVATGLILGVQPLQPPSQATLEPTP